MFRQGARGTIRNSVMSGNYANNGGALRMLDFGSSVEVVVEGTTITGNTAIFDGAGIDLLDVTPVDSSFVLRNSTVSGNVGIGDAAYPNDTHGGGLFVNGMSATIEQSTIADNQVYSSGGGVFIQYATGPVVIEQSTITGNTADSSANSFGSGGGVYSNYFGYGVMVNNSILSGNYQGNYASDFNNVLDELSATYSFFGSSYGLYLPASYPAPDADGNIIGPAAGAPFDPMLGPLQDNGGPTLTRLPMMGSPVIDRGDMQVMGGTDQRGADRVFDGDTDGTATVDMGAVEFGTEVEGVVIDFDNNGLAECADLDLLTAVTAAGTNDPAFDLTGDGLVNGSDIAEWLALAGAAPENMAQTGGNPFLVGDANCDGAVDGADFIAWNSAKFTNSTLWTTGNFDGNAATDGSDFIAWNANKFTASMLVQRPANDGPTIAKADRLDASLRRKVQRDVELPTVRASEALLRLQRVDLTNAGAPSEPTNFMDDVPASVGLVPSLRAHAPKPMSSVTRVTSSETIDAIFSESTSVWGI